MNYDYDLVIIGQRPAAIAAANLALTWGARVALVIAPDQLPTTATIEGLAIAGADVVRGSYRFVSRASCRSCCASTVRQSSQSQTSPAKRFWCLWPWRSTLDRLDLEVVEPLREGRSRILRGQTYLLVPNARPLVPRCPGLDQTPHVLIGDRVDLNNWLRDALDRQLPEQRPTRAIVYGGRSLISLELALTLRDRGLDTHLISRDAAILAIEDSGVKGDSKTSKDCEDNTNPASLLKLWQLNAIAHGLECSMNRTLRGVESVKGELWISVDVGVDVGVDVDVHPEADTGTHTHTGIHPGTNPSQNAEIGAKAAQFTTEQFTTEQLTTDVLLIADPLVPDLDRPHLHSCGVTLSGHHLWVDRYLRTTHPQIYACAAALHGHDAESIATHEALIATRNALLPSWFSRRPNYRAIPWGIATRGGWARVGLDPVQAHAHDAARTFRPFFRSRSPVVTIDLTVQTPDPEKLGFGLESSQFTERGQGASPTAVQVVLTAAGQILGATILGDRAADLIVPFSLAISQRASVDIWKTWAGMESTAGDLGAQLYQIWRDRWWRLHPRWHARVRSWFDDRRG